MRFFVEVTPIGKSDTQKYCVDADSWQKALQTVRSMRKEDGSISGFSIELADDGYRAVDPTARLRYMVKKAPADAPLSEGSISPSSMSARPPAVVAAPAPVPVRQDPVSAPAPVAAVSSAPAAPPVSQIVSVPPTSTGATSGFEPRRPLSRTMSFGSSGTALLASSQPQPAQAAQPAPIVPRASPSKPAPPRAPTSAPSTPPSAPRMAERQAVAVEKTPEKKPETQVSESSPPPSSRRAGGPIVVLYKKEQEPTNASPISYREEVFAAPPSTTEEQAEAILRAQFQLVYESLARAPSGKYVNLAVFDRVFEGRPPVPPLVTLTWKDWKPGGPTLTYPRRAKAQLATSTQPSNLSNHAASATSQTMQVASPLSTAAAQIASTSAMAPSAPPPAHGHAPTPAAVAPSQHPPPVAPLASKPPSRPPSNRPVPQSTDARVVAPVAPPARAHVEMNENSVVIASDSDELPTMQNLPEAISSVEVIVEQPSAPAPIVQPVVHAAPPPAPTPASAPPPQAGFPAPMPIPTSALESAPLLETPAPAPLAQAAAVPPPAASSSAAISSGGSRRASWKQTPAALDGSRVRVRGDELIALLFEEMHDLNFMADALEGAAFCLWVALDKLPSSAGFIHFYDIDKREYVIASVAGVAGVEQATKKISQNDPWLAEAMRRRTAFVVPDARSHEGANVERFAAFGGAKSVIVAPLMLGGRALGAIEIVNPIDGNPFGDDDANAIAYMAEQFAEFVSSHGMVVDEVRIRRASLQPPA